MITFSKNKWLWFCVVLALVICSNLLIYRLESLGPLPTGIALGTLFDFIITIPVLVYFFIVRKRYSLKYILPVMIAGYGAAVLVIPHRLLSAYSFVKYILLAGEAAFFLLELYVVYKLIAKLPKIFKSFRTDESQIPTFPFRMKQARDQHLQPTRVQEVFFSDMTMVYYSLFSWRKRPLSTFPDERIFTFHKKTGSIALYIMLIHALVLESVGFHLFLHSWSPLVAIIALIINVYTLLFFIAEIQAIRHCPIMITNEYLYLQIGIVKQLLVPLEDIKSIRYYDGPEKLTKEELTQVFDAVLADFFKDKPMLEVEFYHPVEARFMYGFKKKVIKAHLRLDEPQKFYQALTEKINRGKKNK
jgi:membrane protein YdbS with pleckstrin-like domain